MFNDFRGYASANTLPKTVRAALIGAGAFGAGVVDQATHTPGLDLLAVADADLSLAVAAYQNAGVTPDRIAVCESASQVQNALEKQLKIVTTRVALVFDLPVDVVVEATGVPEAGAVHAMRAIERGKHVAMVTKETDACVGPVLKHLADQAGVVYSAVDGDQHGLLIGLVRWARTVGLDVICGGKALDVELVLHPGPARLTHWSAPLTLTSDELAKFQPAAPRTTARVAQERRAALKATGGAKPWDIVELTIAANATGLRPDAPMLHGLPLWTTELAAALCPIDDGGILQGPGRIEAVQIIRRGHEVPLQGGVFVVVAVRNEAMRHRLLAHDAVGHPDGKTALIFWPHHLLGVEAVGTVLAAGRHGVATGAGAYRQDFDVVYRTAAPLKAGSVIGDDHSPDLVAEMWPAAPLGPQNPVPAGLARGRRLRHHIPAGTVLTGDLIDTPADSALWSLRRRQDALFPPSGKAL